MSTLFPWDLPPERDDDPGWITVKQVTETGFVVHVLPRGWGQQLIEPGHCNVNCPCRPIPHPLDNDVLVHRSFDGRELIAEAAELIERTK